MCDEIPKPKMRGLLKAQIQRNLTIAITLAGLAVCTKYYFNLRKKKRFADFYANYDIDKEFQDMAAKGLFQSCP